MNAFSASEMFKVVRIKNSERIKTVIFCPDKIDKTSIFIDNSRHCSLNNSGRISMRQKEKMPPTENNFQVSEQ